MGSTKWVQIKFPSPEAELSKPGQKPLTGVEAGISSGSVPSRIKFQFVSIRTCLTSITVNSIEMKHLSFYTL